MDQEKISVIIPVYNAIHYLEEAVHSVLRQNYANIEIILVNDGSTDGSGVLCNSLEQMDKRIKVIIADIRNVAQVRNKIEGLFFDVVIDFLSFNSFAFSSLSISLLSHTKKSIANLFLFIFLK